MDAVTEYRKRRAERLDEYKRGENWVTINGVHVLLDKHGNVINNFKDSDHKLKNLRFVDAVSSHSEGGKKVIDAPIGRMTYEEKFNTAMEKISDSYGGGSISQSDAQRRMANALANLEQGAVIHAGELKALKLGKGLFKLKGEKGNFTAKQLAEKISSGLKVNEFTSSVEGLPTVKKGTNTNIIEKGSKRISHVAENALEDLYNKFKSNKFSHQGLTNLAENYTDSLPKGSVLEVGGWKFKKGGSGSWSIEADGEEHKIHQKAVSSILLNSMKIGYAGKSLKATLPEVSKATEKKVEKAAEEVAKKKVIPKAEKTPEKAPEKPPEKTPEPAPEPAPEKEPKKVAKFIKPVSESLKEIAFGKGTFSEKTKAVTDYLKGLPDGTSISYEAVNKVTGELYVVKGTKEGDQIKFFKKEAPLSSVAGTFLNKITKGLAVGGTDESSFSWTKETAKKEGTYGAPATMTPAGKKKAYLNEKMTKAASYPVDESLYSADKMDAAKKDWESPTRHTDYNNKYKAESKKWFAKQPSNIKSHFEHYTGGGYKKINNGLRSAGVFPLTEAEVNQVNEMTDAIAENKLKEPTILRRGTDLTNIGGWFGMGAKDIQDIMKKGDAALKEAFEGAVGVENGFCSCGSTPNTGMHNWVDVEIYCPEGTEAVFANPWSSCKSSEHEDVGEFETILQRGTAFRITSISSSGYNLSIKCEVVAQKKLLDSFGDDISSQLSKKPLKKGA